MKDDENIKEEIESEVQKYEDDKTSSKDYYESMEEISAWLGELEK